MHPSRHLIHAALAAALLLTACGDNADPGAAADTDDTAADTSAETDTGAEAETDTEAEPAGPADVAVASTDLGDVVVDGEGMTLYLFMPDEQGPSTCYDDCEAAWPPLTVDGEPSAGEGIDASLLGTAEREDGSMQVTYNDWPLYRWQGDTEPGDVTGQNVNDVWFVVSPAGEPITTTPSAAADDSGY